MNAAPMSSKGQFHIPAITDEIDDAHTYFKLPPKVAVFKTTIMSYSASLLSTVVGFPFDTIKTRLQTNKSFAGPLDCLNKTLKHEGPRGLFRGLTAPLLSTSVSKSLSVSLYTFYKPRVGYYQNRLWNELGVDTSAASMGDSGSTRSGKEILINLPNAFLAGSLTGSSVTFFACPFEFTKLFSQIVMIEAKKNLKILGKSNISELVPRSTYQVTRQIIAAEGVFGLYSGLKYHLLREFLSSGIYFSSYETVKLSMNHYFAKNDDVRYSKPVSIVVAGALSGILSWITIFPIDTLKSLIQRDTVNNILRYHSGIKKLKIKRTLQWPTRRMYKGLSITISRSVINSIVFFSAFEFLMTHIG